MESIDKAGKKLFRGKILNIQVLLFSSQLRLAVWLCFAQEHQQGLYGLNHDLFGMWSLARSLFSTLTWPSSQWWWIITNVFSYPLPVPMVGLLFFFGAIWVMRCRAHDGPHPLIVQGCLLREIEDIEYIFLLGFGISHSKIEPLTAAAVFAAQTQYHQTEEQHLEKDLLLLTMLSPHQRSPGEHKYASRSAATKPLCFVYIWWFL